MKDIIVISPAMTSGSKLTKFKTKHPKSFIDVGIAESHALVLASSLALNNKKVFISIYSTFLQRGYDQISHDISRMNSPVVIGIDKAGLADKDGETHHGIYDVAYLSHLPNIIIMAPMDSKEAGNMLYTAFNSKLPCAIRYSRAGMNYNDITYQQIKIGTWQKIAAGEDLTIITYGDFVGNAIEIRKLLLKESIKTEIVNARFIKPFDQAYMTKLFKKNKPIFVYEEVTTIGGLGQMLCQYALEYGAKSKIICLGIKDEFVIQGSREELLNHLKLDPNSIFKIIKKEIRTKK